MDLVGAKTNGLSPLPLVPPSVACVSRSSLQGVFLPPPRPISAIILPPRTTTVPSFPRPLAKAPWRLLTASPPPPGKQREMAGEAEKKRSRGAQARSSVACSPLAAAIVCAREPAHPETQGPAGAEQKRRFSAALAAALLAVALSQPAAKTQPEPGSSFPHTLSRCRPEPALRLPARSGRDSIQPLARSLPPFPLSALLRPAQGSRDRLRSPERGRRLRAPQPAGQDSLAPPFPSYALRQRLSPT